MGKQYIFHFSDLDSNKLLPQTSRALEKRTELLSRKQAPALWQYTDKLNASAKGQPKSRLRTRLMSILCLLLGIFLFVPGLVKPQELLVPLLVGAAAIGAGIGGLWRSRKHKANRFDKSAKLLLQGKRAAASIAFDESGMKITAAEDNELIPYASLEYIIEAEDILLLFFDEKVMLLQKAELAEDFYEFRQFISEKAAEYHKI